MGNMQPVKGNPELKQVFLSTGFVGGVNLSYADDIVNDKDFRYLSNFDLATQGSLPKRKGWGKKDALTHIFLDRSYSDTLSFEIFDSHNSTIKTTYAFVMLTDTINLMSLALNYATFAELKNFLANTPYFNQYGITLKFIIIIRLNETIKYNCYEVKLDPSKPISTCLTRQRIGEQVVLNGSYKYKNALFNIQYVTDERGVYFCDNDFESPDQLVWFDLQTNNFKHTTNDVYKPASLEIRKVGFNVLSATPLTWIASSGITTESIQGMYITSMNNIPLLSLPVNESFKVNILFTGTKNTFKFVFTNASTIGNATPETFDVTAEKIAEESTAGLAVYKITFKTQPTVDVEIKISFEATGVSVQPYIDYYDFASINPNAKPVKNLSLKGYSVTTMSQRAVYYGLNTIWFSEIGLFDYVPNYNYVIVPIDSTDKITKIVYFSQNLHIVFTERSIWKLTGSFGSDDFGVYLVSDSIGCVCPNTISLVEDKIVFLSNQGLKALKNSFYRTDLQNIETLDTKIRPIMEDGNRNAYATLFKDQYMLFNNYRGAKKTREIQSTIYDMPDTIRYYYEFDSFVFTNYANKPTMSTDLYPPFIVKNSGNLLSFVRIDNTEGVYLYGDGYLDFGYSYRSVIETARLSFGYPLHLKKIKNVVFKLSGGLLPQAIYLTVYADATKISDYKLHQTHINPLGEVVYETIDDPSFVVPSSLALFGSAVFGESKLGYTPIFLAKQRVSTKCKNISIKIECENEDSLALLSLGYTFVLRKIK